MRFLRGTVRGDKPWEKQQSRLSYGAGGFVLRGDVPSSFLEGFHLNMQNKVPTGEQDNFRLMSVCICTTHTTHTGVHYGSVLKAGMLESDTVIRCYFNITSFVTLN